MGILDDLQMGLGMKERTEDYDARTARNVALQQAYGDDDIAKMRARQNYQTTTPSGGTFNYGDYYRGFLNAPQGNAQSFLRRQGGEGYSPSIMQDNRPFFQRALFSQQDTPSPTRYGIGPVKLDGPLRIPSVLGMVTGALSSFGNRAIPTVSAPGGAMRVRPSGYGVMAGLTDDDMGLPDGPVPDIRLRRAAGTYTAPYDVSSGTSLLDDYDYLMDPDMPMTVGLAPKTSDAPDTADGAGVTFEEFMDLQRQMEATYGLPELSADQYRKNYERQYGG